MSSLLRVSQQLSPSPEFGLNNGTNKKGSNEKKHATKLSTSSPEAIRVASAITPNRLANLLIRKGPLAIRLITGQLSIEVPGFELLSLSKQRRLIMAAMEQGDPQNDVVFEKIGWGQWAVRHVDSDYIVTEPNGALKSTEGRMNIHELKEKAKLGWSKKESPPRDTSALSKNISRRASISNNKANMHNFRVPGERMENQKGRLSESESDSDDGDLDIDIDQGAGLSSPVLTLRSSLGIDTDDNALEEYSEEEEDELFPFENDEHNISISRFKRSPPVKFANRVPSKSSPPPVLGRIRRKSSSAVTKPSRHQLFNRSRLNSIENLDDYVLSSARTSVLSISSPPLQNGSHASTSPLGSWGGKSEYWGQSERGLSPELVASAFHHASRRKSSFNESSIRSTLSSSMRPYEHGSVSLSSSAVTKTHHRRENSAHDGASDTDEEDWATMGAATLRSHSEGIKNPEGHSQILSEERLAARALVNLMGM